MKKLLFVLFGIILIGSLLMGGCSKESTPSTTPTTPKPSVTSQPSPTPSAPSETKPLPLITPTQTAPVSGPQSGGTLKVVAATGLADLGYPPEMQMTDEATAKTFAECLVSWEINGEYTPELATSWDLDPNAKTLTFHLRKGVKFHDGTDFNAEAVRWNMQQRLDTGRMVDAKYLDSIEVLDDDTFRFNLNTWFNPAIMLHSYAYAVTMYSPTAFETYGKDWAISHYISTGPFKFDHFERDVSLRIVRNDNYWRGPEYPYLDAIEFTFFADPVAQSAAMQSGEGDAWYGATLKYATDLEKRGLLVTYQTAFYSDIIPDTKMPGGVFQNKAVREALEYAIDKEGLAMGLGYGKAKPVRMLGPEGSAGYNPDFPFRDYDPDKAKQLLASAGYPDGFKTTMMVMQGDLSLPQAIQQYLAEVGIQVELDVADPGRFFAKVYHDGWDGGLMMLSVPVDPEFFIGWSVHFGREPIVFYSSIQWPDEYWNLVDQCYMAPDTATGRAATKAMTTFASEEAMIIPLIDVLNTWIVQPYVHSTRLHQHFMVWHTWEEWMEEH